MNSMRWDPFREIVGLREVVNGLLEESMIRPRAGFMAVTGSVPVDVKETDDSYVVLLPLPGVNPADVDISVLGSSVRVTGEFKDAPAREGETSRWLVRERRLGHFERSVTLPTTISAERATAEFDSGILMIRLPKAEAARPLTIPVKSTDAPDTN